ncbi:cytokine receptor isoform X2 [Lepeophtheirus salmonis]|uniref:cytokine receptor isoform X2 n=1 Tax=Lepeophtheirus salmonis TaxID=72036 RepID=UPI001AE20D19|nr:cytokine receptor-like isoform X2 [Lepeophtheirus salmonis]
MSSNTARTKKSMLSKNTKQTMAIERIWSCFLCAIFTLLLGLIEVSSSDDFNYQCFEGFAIASGFIAPRHDLNVETGSAPITFYCTLNPNFEYYSRDGARSSNLTFNFERNQDYPIETRILNETTIAFDFVPNHPMSDILLCKLVTPNANNKGICSRNVNVGYLPKEPEDFNCISKNWQSLNCTWSISDNPIVTNYELTYFTTSTNHMQECPKLDSKTLPGFKYHPKNFCYWDLRTHPQYRAVIETYHFLLNCTNKLNPSGNLSFFSINNYAVVQPDPVNKVQITSHDQSTLILEYQIPLELRYFSPGLYQWIQYKSEYESSWINLDVGKEPMNNFTFKYFLTDLKAYTNYTVRIRLLSGKRNFSHEDPLWSEERLGNARTLPSVPVKSPNTVIGSFEIISGFDSRDIYVYWQQVEKEEELGPNFGYRVTEVFEGDKVVPISPKWVTSAYAYFPRMSLNSYTFYITSENFVGQAPSTSKVFVADYDKLKQLQPRSFTKIAYDDDKFEVSWLKPIHYEMVDNYTVFWCQSERDRPYQCKGYLDWVFVDRDVRSTNITVDPNFLYQFAVSANSKEYSSGMVWATCTIIANKVNGKLKNVFVDLVQTTRLKVRWRLDCSDRVGIVSGYKISYCAINSPNPDAKCDNNSLKTAMADPDKSEFIVNDLDPYVYYKVGVSVVTRGGEGEVSDYVVNRTSPARPGSPPRNFQITVKPPRKVFLSWDPPLKPNGPISFYQIEGSYINYAGSFIRTFFQSKTLTSEVLDSKFLVSNTKYHIAIRACTSIPQFDAPSCGLVWNNQSFVTPSGESGKMKDPIVYFENSTLLQVSWDMDSFHKGGEISHYEVRLTKGENLVAPIFPSTKEQSVMSVSLNDLDDPDDWIISDCGSSSTKAEPYNVTVRAVTFGSGSKKEFWGPWSNPTSTLGYCSRYIPIGFYMGITSACVLVGIFGILYGVRFYILSKDKRIQFDEVERKLSAGFISKNMVDKFNTDDTVYGTKIHQKFDRSNSMTTLLNKDPKVIVESSNSCSSITSGRTSSRIDDDTFKTLQSDYESEQTEESSSLNSDKGPPPTTLSSGYVSCSSPSVMKPPSSSEEIHKDITMNPITSTGYVSFDEVVRKEAIPSLSSNGYVALGDVKLNTGDFHSNVDGGGNAKDIISSTPACLKNNSYTRVSMLIPHEYSLKKNHPHVHNFGYQNLHSADPSKNLKNMHVELKKDSGAISPLSRFHSVKTNMI